MASTTRDIWDSIKKAAGHTVKAILAMATAFFQAIEMFASAIAELLLGLVKK